MKFRDRLIRFMYGRYGVDGMYYGLLILYFILFIANMFIRSNILSIIMTLVLVYAIFRMMSKNHIARRKELAIYVKLTAPIKRFFKLNFKRIRDIRTKRYRVCKNCKAVTRLPIKRGKHTVKCPKCGNTFKVKILF